MMATPTATKRHMRTRTTTPLITATILFLLAILPATTTTWALTVPATKLGWNPSSSSHMSYNNMQRLTQRTFLSTSIGTNAFRTNSNNNFRFVKSTVLVATSNGDDKNAQEQSDTLAVNMHMENNNHNMQPQVYPQRWVQLGYLSILALLSDWICFSVAAAPDTFEMSYNGHSAASLIDMFLFMNVASCFLVTDIVAKFGLQRCIQAAAMLMTMGCWFRSGFAFLLPMAHAIGMDAATTTVVTALTTSSPIDISTFSTTSTTIASSSASAAGLVPYPLLVVGTLLVGAAQPFFQCTPPLLSAQWFASDERATSTAVALNFNQIGIATAFLVGGSMATDAVGLEQYFGIVTLACTVVTLGTLVQYENLPPTPPSSSELEKLRRNEKEPPFWESVQTFFATPGFTRPLAAFVCSITITNVVGAFIDDVMKRGGITEQFHIDLAGAAFEIAILFGGIVIGGYVDRTKQYKQVTMACIASTAALLIPLGLTEHAIGNEPILLILALLGLGMAAGPVQPINAELAVDVTYPGDETAVESVQQIGGNLISALLVPLAEKASEVDYQILPKNPELASDIRGDVVLLTVIAGLTLAYFASFDAPLRRSIADEMDGEHGQESIPNVMEVVAVNETSHLNLFDAKGEEGEEKTEEESLNILF